MEVVFGAEGGDGLERFWRLKRAGLVRLKGCFTGREGWRYVASCEGVVWTSEVRDLQ